MTREELIRKLNIVQSYLDRVYQTMNSTTIPPYEYVSYLKDELGLDLEKIKE